MIRTAISPKPRRSKCRICHASFTKARTIQPTCGKFECQVAYASKVAQKAAAKRVSEARKLAAAQRKEDKAKILALKGLSYWEGRAQHWVNKFVRLRDEGDGCISCGITYSTVWQAGHYISVGANSTLRYHEDNIHLQCVQCNKDKGSNRDGYRPRLIAKIGLERVLFLEGWHPPVKSTIADCQAIEAKYKAKIKMLQRQKKEVNHA